MQLKFGLMPDLSRSSPAHEALARWENEGGAREAVDTALPGPVFEMARQWGVEPRSCAHRVTLAQTGDMRLGKRARRSRSSARQTIERKLVR